MTNQISPSSISVGIYVPSYKRSNRIVTYHFIDQCVYVVRESEAELYRNAGVDRLLVAPDEEINSLSKIRQWIIDNTPEDIIIQVDDDIKAFAYVNKNNIQVIEDKEIIITEFERVAQMLHDLELGFASLNMTPDVKKYNKEFQFKGVIGGVVWFNKKHLKGKYDTKNKTKCDIDFQLQELLHNRIIIVPAYFAMKSEYDKNEGVANIGKNTKTINEVVSYMKLKWGKHYDFDFKRNVGKINVKR